MGEKNETSRIPPNKKKSIRGDSGDSWPVWNMGITLCNSKSCIFANSEDPHVMPLKTAFHQGLSCLLRQNRSSVCFGPNNM